MGLTVTNSAGTVGAGASRQVRSQGSQNLHVWLGTIAFDDAYPTGGEAFNAQSVTGFRAIEQVWVMPFDGFVFQYVDSATAGNRKIKAYWVDTTVDGAKMSEVADTTDINANLTAVPVIIWGYK